MITKVVMPQLSLSMREGIVTRWLKKEGDFVRKGEPVCEIEGDKAITEVEAPVSGYVKMIVAVEGEEFPVREAMLYLGDPGDIILPTTAAAVGRGTELAHTAPVTEAGAGTVQTELARPDSLTSPTVEAAPGKVLASPVAKRLAAELGIDLRTVKGSGPDGLIGKEDVLSAKAEHSPVLITSPRPKSETIEPRGIKKIVAERMTESYLASPHIHLSLSCNLSKVVDLRGQSNQKLGSQDHLTFTDILVWACSRVLVRHPLLNASFQDGKITTYSDVNISFATASEKGLVVPVIKSANRLSLLETTRKRQELVERSNSGRQTPDDLSGGTFTITNLGMYEVEQFDAIINPGQSGILSAGKITPTPVADEDGGIAVKPMINLTLACDHRVADGVDGARFLSDLKKLLENPQEMFQAL